VDREGEQVLGRLDEALLRLRRVTAAPPPAFVVEDASPGGAAVTASTVLVVDACARADGEVSVGEVARVLGVEHSTASRLVERAVRGGFVVRGPSAADARRVALTLTPAGAALQERAVAFRVRRLGQVVGGWRADDVLALAGLLERFAAGAAEAGPGGPGGPGEGQ
jgi:DNA-binding MarR family transcriptional regulator